jgi:hypothetical protein
MKACEKISFRFIKTVSLKTITVFLALQGMFLTQQALGQMSDDFSDGDFISNPIWSGTSSAFIINSSHQLQVSNTIAATSYLSTPLLISFTGNIEWEFYIKQSFSGSGGNFSRIYLASDQQNLTMPLNGYYLQFGEAGSNDAITLFRQSGTTSTLVCRAPNGGITAAFSMRVKVSRSSTGLWEIFMDNMEGAGFVSQAQGTDNVHASSSYFGLRSTYTLSNATKFFYDDFAITIHPAPDVTSPTLLSVFPVSSTVIEVEFSENVEAGLAEDESNYSIEGISPAMAILQSNQHTVSLTFIQPFTNGLTVTLSLKSIQDLAGNKMAVTNEDFMFFQSVNAINKDIVITEILADPSPPLNLPESEFIELYNRSDNPFDLKDWTLTDGSSAAKLSSLILLPHEYLILCSATRSGQFTLFGRTLGVTAFPSLNNTGEALVLKDPTGLTIDSVNYSDTWYKDNEMKDGGWSLELIDPENTCADSENWIVSEDEHGGTPGKQNSVFANKPDVTGPTVISAFPVSGSVIILQFNEKLSKTLPSLTNIVFQPPQSISKISFADKSLTVLQLTLASKLAGGLKYVLSMSNVYDCAGNGIQQEFSSVTFALPEKADSLDLVVNEVLYNPRPTGVDFVEVYNRSSKFINLKNWKLANGLGVNKIISGKDLLLEPEGYIVLTTDGNVLKGEYILGAVKNFLNMTMPPLSDDEGTITLTDDQGEIIDSFSYSEKLHSKFLKDNEGVSLERITFARPTSDQQNWKSASSTVGYATPGYLNSNARTEGLMNDQSIAVQPEIFVPLYGQPDFTEITYDFEQGGYVANVKILDPQGREIKQLANNELLSKEGSFRWDGDQENGNKARIGAYMVWFEIFDSSGIVKTFRKRVVIADKF